jgi:hypothetical protein
MENEKLRAVPDSVRNRVREFKPRGQSSFIKSPLFYEVLEQMAMGATASEVSYWTGSNNPDLLVKTCVISRYIRTHIPDIASIGRKGMDDVSFVSTGMQAIQEAETVCALLKGRMAQLDAANSKDGHWNIKLARAAKDYMDSLERLQKMRYDVDKRHSAEVEETKVASDKWTPEFAAAIAKLIVDEKSKSDGLLRKFQPPTIDDAE